MIEAQIICSAPCDIPDLGLFGLRRGDERWVSDLAASRSQDLVKEQRRGAVRVYRKTRRAESAPRRPAPPFVAHSRPSGERPDTSTPPRERVVEKETVVERVVEVSAPVDAEGMARQMKAEILGDLLGDLLPGIRAVVQEEVGRAAAASSERAGIDAGQLEDVLESVMRRVLPEGAPARSSGSTKTSRPEPDEPLFIPSSIVDKDAKGRISVKSETSGETDSLDDAQDMLREMKRGRGGGRTTEKEDK